MAEWLKGLRTTPDTPMTRAINNRYGSGSRGAGELEAELDSSGGARSEPSARSLSAAASRRNTPRVAGAYERPWKQEPAVGPSGTGRGTPRARLASAGAHRTPVPRTGSDLLDGGAAAAADSASVAGSDDVSGTTEDDLPAQEGDSVQVFVRVRPVNAAEEAEAEQYSCTRIFGDRTLCVDLRHRPEPYSFKFDCVLPETTTQQEIFDRAGKPIVDNCMGGYNSSIFAYGQTGAGKTHTMQGPLKAAAAQDGSDERGLAPRVFEYLFTEIDKAQDDNCHENLTFCCRVSMLEIYNEVITDLLNPAATNLQIREDIKRGCYVEDLSEHLIQNVSDAMRLMRMGAENRHVGETRLNRESSRSHSVFACTLERQSKSADTGVTNVLFSRLNLIDLAGSERIHGGEHGGSQATGQHFKEACHINKSLTTLGRVIMELVEAQRSSSSAAGRQGGGGPGGSATKAGVAAAAAARMRHVPYRDSRLTFLLQDSLGGNAKTLMIANISPSSVSVQETLSTLHFMSRAKCIRNRAQINLDARGDVVLLQRELVRLNMELDNLRKGYTEPAIQESKELREKLDKMSTAEGQMKIVLTNMEKENQNLKAERRRLDHKMAQIQKGAGQLDAAIFSLTTKLMSHEALAAAALQTSVAAGKAEHELELRLVALRLEAAQQASEGSSELQGVVDDLQEQLASAQQQGAAASADLGAATAQVADLKQQLDAAQQEARQEAQQMTMVQQEALALAEQLGAAQAESAGLKEQLDASHARAAQLAAATQEAAALSQQLREQHATREAELVSCTDAAEAAGQRLQQELQAARAEAASLADNGQQLQQQLEREQQAVAQLKEEAAAAQAQLSSMQQDLQAAREQASSSAEEASSCLADVQAERDTAQAALQEAVSRNTGLEEQLQELKVQLEQAQQQHQAEAAARQAEAAAWQAEAEAAVGAAAAAAAIEQQLADAQQLLAGKTEDLSGILADKQELHSRLGLKQQQCSELQQQLEAEQGRSADGRSQVAALESDLSDARAALKDKCAVLDAAQEQAKQLQQAAEAAAAAAAARADQLASDLAAARESSKSRQEELLKQVTEVHLQLSTAQAEQERLQDELDASRSDVGLLQAQLAEARGEVDSLRGQASSKGLDCELLRKKLAAADAAAAALRDDVGDTQQQVAELKHQLQQAEDAADAQQHQAAEQLSDLQRQLLDARQELDARAFDAGQLQRRMEELSNRLADKSASLEAAKEEVRGLKAGVSRLEGVARQRDAQLAEKTARVIQLEAENEGLAAHNADLTEQNACQNMLLMEQLSVNELALKEQIVYNARNTQAMNEIRKVINWAQQPVAPPHSSAAAAGAAVGASCPVRPGSSQRHCAARQQQQHQQLDSAPSSPPGFAPDAQGCGLPPHSPAADAAELLPDGTRAAAGPLPVAGGGGRHGHSHARHHRHHQQGRDRYGDRASERYGELLATAAASSAEGIAGSTNISHGSTGSTAGPMAGAGESGDLEVESRTQPPLAGHTAAAAATAARRSSGGRDTAPLVPLASSSHEALQLRPSGSGGIGRGRMRGGAESPTRCSGGSKQHLVAAAAAVQHRAQPDQQAHHHHQALERDDVLLGAAPGLGQEGSLDTEEGRLLCSRNSRGELPGDGNTRQLLVPQRVSSPLTSPKQQLHASAARARGGRDAGSRGAHGLRMGSDGASFSAALVQQKQQQHRGSSSSGSSSKRPAVLQPGAAPSVALSVSTEWAGGARDSTAPDMRLPAAIVGGDCEPEP